MVVSIFQDLVPGVCWGFSKYVWRAWAARRDSRLRRGGTNVQGSGAYLEKYGVEQDADS